MGIISGFLGGAGRGTAEFGQIMLMDKLTKERDEANHLRNMELNKGQQEFTAEENRKGREFKQKLEDTKASGGTDKIRNAQNLMSQGYPKDVSNAVAQGAMKTVKDEDTGDMVVVNTLNNQEVGRLRTTDPKGGKTWVPAGKDSMPVEPTTEDIKQAAQEYDEEASIWRSDKSQFGMSESKYKSKRAKEIAQERANRPGGKGIVASKSAKAEPKKTVKQLTPDEYRSKMKARYPDIPDNELNRLLEAARQAGKIRG